MQITGIAYWGASNIYKDELTVEVPKIERRKSWTVIFTRVDQKITNKII